MTFLLVVVTFELPTTYRERWDPSSFSLDCPRLWLDPFVTMSTWPTFESLLLHHQVSFINKTATTSSNLKVFFLNKRIITILWKDEGNEANKSNALSSFSMFTTREANSIIVLLNWSRCWLKFASSIILRLNSRFFKYNLLVNDLDLYRLSNLSQLSTGSVKPRTSQRVLFVRHNKFYSLPWLSNLPTPLLTSSMACLLPWVPPTHHPLAFGPANFWPIVATRWNHHGHHKVRLKCSSLLPMPSHVFWL